MLWVGRRYVLVIVAPPLTVIGGSIVTQVKLSIKCAAGTEKQPNAATTFKFKV